MPARSLRILYVISICRALKSKEVLEQVIHAGAKTKDFFGTAYGQTNGKFEGFRLGNPGVS